MLSADKIKRSVFFARTGPIIGGHVYAETIKRNGDGVGSGDEDEDEGDEEDADEDEDES